MFNIIILFILTNIILLTDTNISNTIIILVSNYFYTFRYCWNCTLTNMTIMINNYILFLNNMVICLTTYPNNIIMCITSIILFYIVFKIIKIII